MSANRGCRGVAGRFSSAVWRKISDPWNRNRSAIDRCAITIKKKKKEMKRLALLLQTAIRVSEELNDDWVAHLLRADGPYLRQLKSVIGEYADGTSTLDDQDMTLMFQKTTPQTRSEIMMYIIGECAKKKYLFLDGRGKMRADTPRSWLGVTIKEYYKFLKDVYDNIAVNQKDIGSMPFVQSIVGSIAPFFIEPSTNKADADAKHQAVVELFFEGVAQQLNFPMEQEGVATTEDPFALGKVSKFWSSV